MMVAIFVVLVIIAVVLAPWLFAVLAAAAALYGFWLVALAIFCLIGGVVAVFWAVASRGNKDQVVKLTGERKACRNCYVEMPADARRCRSCGAEN